nr:arsenical pump-driving ATPase [uncultured Anaeromusa sp.]
MKTFPLYQASVATGLKYLFFTGKGGVGKTSIACATAVSLADTGKKVLLVSTDPASNLQDVFGRDLDGKGVAIAEVPGLVVANLNPEEAAREYRESVIGPYRGKLPESVLQNMEEQLSGSCTVEIAAFNEFSRFITDDALQQKYDHILFDTAPTGHTLRMLQLPSAWSSFISESTHGASCLGQLAGLEEQKDMYKQAVATLADGTLTALVLVTRPEESPLKEAARSSMELRDLGIKNQLLVVNGVVSGDVVDDELAQSMQGKQQEALSSMPADLAGIPPYSIPLRAYNVTGLDNIRAMLKPEQPRADQEETVELLKDLPALRTLIDSLYNTGKKVIFTMGKGGVGKTTLAAAIALGLAQKGAKVQLTTTDPAAHLEFVLSKAKGITLSRIDEEKELEAYRQEVLAKAAENMGGDDLAYIEEDLRSPCTQEIAVFRAFAEIVAKAGDEVVVIDTAPTGHTLLLLDATQSYHHEVERTQGQETPLSVQQLLPRLRNEAETEVVIVTLPEATPVFEAERLSDDLARAGIHNNWWIVNASFRATNTTHPLLRARALSEANWIERVAERSKGHYAVIPWKKRELKDEVLLELLQ